MSVFRVSPTTYASGRFRLKTCAVASFPVIVLVGSIIFYVGLFQSWNSAPLFLEHASESRAGDAWKSAVDVCRVSPSKVQVEAWVALQGHARGAHESSLLIRDGETGEHVRMKSRVVLRPDVSKALNEQFGDQVDYVGTGLQGSLNFQKGGRGLSHGQIVAAYDTGRGFLLVELPCKF